MLKKSLFVKIIPQLKDNYCYLIIKDQNVIIIDPAESDQILKYIKEKKLKINAILITHHHSDHTSGIESMWKNI